MRAVEASEAEAEESVQELQEEFERRVEELEEALSIARGAEETARAAEAAETGPERTAEPEISAGAVAAAISEAREKAREGAYGDVLDYLSYIGGGESETLRRQVEETAEESIRYRSIINRFQELLDDAAEEARRLETVETRLIGTVGSVTAGRVFIEPIVATPVEEGTTIIIRRRTSSGEIPIATGEVYEVSAGRISARLKSRLSVGRSPLVMDLVYMEVRE